MFRSDSEKKFSEISTSISTVSKRNFYFFLGHSVDVPRQRSATSHIDVKSEILDLGKLTAE